MENNEIRKIAILLAKRNIVWKDLSKQKKELAIKVFSIVNKKLERLEELRAQLKENTFTKSSLADELQLNRKTLGHNNPEISALIDELYSKAKTIVGSDDIKALLEENKELKSEINKMVARDIDSLTKEIEFENLKDLYNEQKIIAR